MTGKRPRPQGVRGLVWPALLAAALIAGLALARPAALGHLDGRVYDLLLREVTRGPASERVVIVDVDERSLAHHGRWPWPRSRVAAVLDQVRAMGAAAVGLDVMFPEPDESEGRAIGSADGLTPGDATFARALAAGPFVVGYEFTFGSGASGGPGGRSRTDGTGGSNRAPGATPGGIPGERTDCVLHGLPAARLDEAGGETAGPFQATGAICSLPGVARAAGASGFLNAGPDADGMVRRLPLVITRDGVLYPSLALATFVRATRPHQILLKTTRQGAATLALDRLTVPLDPGATLLLRFRGGKGAFPTVSAGDLLDGGVPAGALRDRLVLFGTSALGLRDAAVTPVDTTLAGIELHATALDNLLRGDFVRRPAAAPWLELGGAVVTGALSAVTVGLAGIAWGGAILAGVGLLAWLGAAWLLDTRGFFISPLLPIMALATSFVALTLARYLGERRRADRTAQDLRQARELVLHALTSLTETRDNETGAHLLRTRRYMQALCSTLAGTPRFRRALTPEVIDLLVQLAPIHDIGKVGVSDKTLHKPGPFDDAERAEMRQHPALGRDVIANAERRVGMVDDLFLTMAKDIVYAHHERWDGSGYPEGLRGEAIPLAGRLVAVVDVYDALFSRRVYKDGMPHDEIVRHIRDGRGTQFDPDVVDAFLAVHEEWRTIARELADDGSDRLHP